MQTPGWGRWPRRLAIAGISLLTVLVLLVGLLQVPAIATWVTERLLTLVPLNPGYALDVVRVSGNWITGLQAEGITLRHRGRGLARIDHIAVRYDPRDLIGPDRRLEDLTVAGGEIAARREAEGWDIANAFPTSEDTAAAGGAFAIDRLRVRDIQAMAVAGPDSIYRLRNLTLTGRDLVLGDVLLLTMDTLHASVAPPGDPPLWIEIAASGAATAEAIRLDPLRIKSRRSDIDGHLVLPRSFDEPRLAEQLSLRLRALPLAMADVAAFYPAIRADGHLRLEAVAAAEGRLVTAQLAARLGDANMNFEGGTTVGRGAPAVYRLSGEVSRLDPSRLHQAAPPGVVNAVIDADLRGETLPVASGHATLRLRRSRLGGTDLRQLDLSAEVERGRAVLDLRGRALGGSIRAGGWARPFDSVPSYALTGRAAGLDGTGSIARMLAGGNDELALAIGFKATGEGVAKDAAEVEGRVSLAAVGGEKPISLGDARLRYESGRLEIRPRLLVAGGRIRGIATANLGDTITYRIRRGVIDSVDLGRLLGDTVAAPLSARFTLQGRGIDPEATLVTARLEMDDLRYGARRLEQVVARARMTGRRATLDLRGSLQGGRLALDAVARPVGSATAFTVRRASLDSVDLGTLLGRPDLAGPVTMGATGRGRWGESVRAFTGRLTMAPSRLGGLQVEAGRVEADLSGERLTYDASLKTSGGSLAVEGQGRPFEAVPSFALTRGRADSLDLGVLLGRDSLETALHARFSGSVAGTSIDSMLARLDLELLASRVNRADLGPGRLVLDLDRGRLRGDVDVEGEDAEIAAEVTGALARDSSRIRAGGRLRIERLAEWTGRQDPDGRLEGRFELDASADTAGLESIGGEATVVGGLGDVRVETLHLAFQPRPGALQLDTLILRSNVASLDGGGGVALAPRFSPPLDTVRIVGQTGDVAPLASLAGLDSLYLDSASVALTVTGPPDRRWLGGRLDAFRLLYGSNLAERLSVGGSGTVDSAGLGALAGTLRIEGAAVGEVTVREVELAGRYDSTVSLQGDVVLSDDVRLGLDLRGARAGDTTRAVLRKLQLVEGGRTWNLRHPVDLAIRPGVVAVDDLILAAGAGTLAVDGIVDRRDSSDLTLRIEQFSLDALAKARLVPVAGRLDGAIHLSGPATAASLVGRLGFVARDPEGAAVGRVDSRVEWTRAGLQLEALALPRQGGRLTLNGTLPWRLTLAPEDTAATVGVTRAPADTMSLAMRADSFDLAFFQAFLPEETARGLTGDLAMNARLTGSLDQPEATGRVDVRGLEVTLPAVGVTYADGRLDARLEKNRLLIDTLLLTSGGKGRLLARGTVLLEPLADPTLEIAARLEEFRISNSETLRSVATGDLELRGTAGQPVLAGRVELGPTEIIVGGETAAAVEEVELTPAELLEVARRFGPRAVLAADAGPGLVDRFRIDLEVEFPNQVWFRKPASPSIAIELGGKITVRQKPGEEMQFFGSVQPIPGRGEIDLYGRTFEITEGDIILQGPAEAVTLDVTAQYQVPTQGDPDDEEVLIFVDARGRPDSLQLEFRAEPSMSNEDIISYIVTGRPASDNPLLAAQAEGGVDASQVAIAQVAGTLGGAVGEELGFDVFQIRQESDRGLTLTAGRYLTPRVYVNLQQPLRIGPTAEQQVTGASGPGFELEYTLRHWLRGTLRGGSLPTSILLRGRYGF